MGLGRKGNIWLLCEIRLKKVLVSLVVMSNDILEQTREFLENAFIENPHFSFGNWRIMYNHSLLVLKFALGIAEEIDCDKLVLSVGSLLHDIGKAYKADEQLLREKHEELGYEISQKFLEKFNFSDEQRLKLKDIFLGDGKSVERQIIKDADIVAFFADERLQKALKSWADKRGLTNELQRKLDKVRLLHFGVSKKIAEPFYKEMKKRWDL